MAQVRVAVLGAGNIGGTLGRKWAAAGNHVSFGVSNPRGSKSEALRADLGDTVKIGSVADALAAGDVVLVAVPGGTVDELVKANAALLDGKIIIDAANRMGGSGPMNSLATFKSLTPSAHVFRAFNSYGWENFANPVYNGVQGDLFYSGPDGAPRQTIEQLIEEIGLRPIWLGDADRADAVDAVLTLWFSLVRQGKGRHLAFKLLTD